MYQHQLENPKEAVKVPHFTDWDAIISEMFQMERHVPFEFPAGISWFSGKWKCPLVFDLAVYLQSIGGRLTTSPSPAISRSGVRTCLN